MKTYPKKEKVVKDFSPEARAKAMAERKNVSFVPMTESEAKKYDAKQNVVSSNKFEGMTLGEINRENANNSLKS